MKRWHGVSLAATLALAGSLIATTYAQQQPPPPQQPRPTQPGQQGQQGQAPQGQQGGGSPFGAVTPQTKTKVVVIGENNAVRKLDKAGGTAISNAELFRVVWSPAGAGTLCVLSVSGQANPADNFRWVIYDNKAVYDYMIKEIRTDYANYTPVYGSITQRDSMANGFSRTETCRTATHTVDLVWLNLKAPNFVDITMFQGTTQMALNIVPASSGDIVIDGKSAPGTWYEQGGGIATGAYLALGEAWRR